MRVVKHSNFRVEVYLRRPGDLGSVIVPDSWAGGARSEEESRKAAEHIAGMIRRHVRPLDDDRGEVIVACDSEPQCSHCGSKWTGDSRDYNGGCCAMDEEQNPEAMAGNHDTIPSDSPCGDSR
jgi:hypothetical protein